jgi:hypothetical protein
MQQFNVTSGELVIGDPLYTINPPKWSTGIIKAKNGIWEAKPVYFCDKQLRTRISEIYAYNLEAAFKQHSLIDDLQSAPPLPFINGVESGQLGYFDRSGYRKDDEYGTVWYITLLQITLSEMAFGVIPDGAVASTGYGENSFSTQGIFNEDGECIALRTVFITEQVDDEDDFWFMDDDIYDDDDDDDNDKIL